MKKNYCYCTLLLCKSVLLDKYKNILNNIEFFEKQILSQEKHKGLKKTCMKTLNELVLQLFIE